MKRAILPILALFLMGCAVSQSVETKTYQALFTSKMVYETTMEMVADLQAQGLISGEQRTKINEKANAYADAHLAAAKALYAYHLLEDEASEEDLLFHLQVVQTLYAEFLAFVRPMILDGEE